MAISNAFAMEYWSAMLWADWYRMPGMMGLGYDVSAYMTNARKFRENEGTLNPAVRETTFANALAGQFPAYGEAGAAAASILAPPERTSVAQHEFEMDAILTTHLHWSDFDLWGQAGDIVGRDMAAVRQKFEITIADKIAALLKSMVDTTGGDQNTVGSNIEISLADFQGDVDSAGRKAFRRKLVDALIVELPYAAKRMATRVGNATGEMPLAGRAYQMHDWVAAELNRWFLYDVQSTTPLAEYIQSAYTGQRVLALGGVEILTSPRWEYGSDGSLPSAADADAFDIVMLTREDSPFYSAMLFGAPSGGVEFYRPESKLRVQAAKVGAMYGVGERDKGRMLAKRIAITA